jgi:hypothetical protein
MNSSQETIEKIRRDFVFFVAGIPEEMVIHNEQYTFAQLGEDQRKQITKIAEHSQGVANWLRNASGRISAAVFRNEFPEEKEGFNNAHERLSAILDGYAFLIEDVSLDICPLVLIRENSETDAQIKFFGNRAWISWGTPDEKAKQLWQTRKAQLLERFLIFFDAVAGDAAPSDSEIIDQLGLSAKMFRHGNKSNSYGIEFVCKFTALEGIVCGSEIHGKGALLKSRLSSLFRSRNGVEEEVAKLWKMRCEASHQGKAFSNDFSAVIEPLERLTLGAMVFALDNLKSAKTIDGLWNGASSYTLPNEVLLARPTNRAAVIQMIGDYGTWKGAGILTDHVFSQLSKIFQKNTAQNQAK